MKLAPSEVANMSVVKIAFFCEEIEKDIKAKDPWLSPPPKIQL
jgi:hypothetical protein